MCNKIHLPHLKFKLSPLLLFSSSPSFFPMGHGKRRSSRIRSLSEHPAVVFFTNKLGTSGFSPPLPRGNMANLRNWCIHTLGPDFYCNCICIQINTWQSRIRLLLSFPNSMDNTTKRPSCVAWKKILPVIPTMTAMATMATMGLWRGLTV